MREEFIAADGTTSFEQESIWNGSEWLLLNSTAYEYDEQQSVVKTTHGNGRFSTTAWMCCGRLSETNEDGITTAYGYNSAHQLVEIIRAEVKDGDVIVTPESITTYTRDAAGRTLTTRRDIGAMTTTESTEYDILGRTIRSTDILGRVTTTAYSTDGLTTTTVTLTDGSILSQSITNGNGQTLVTATPNTLGGFIYTRSEYNAKGQLTKQYQDTGSNTAATAPTLYEYDSFGNMVKQTLALVDSPTKDNSPVVEMAYSVESTEAGVFSITSNNRYNAESEPLTSVQKQLLSQLSSTLSSKSIGFRGSGITSETFWFTGKVTETALEGGGKAVPGLRKNRSGVGIPPGGSDDFQTTGTVAQADKSAAIFIGESEVSGAGGTASGIPAKAAQLFLYVCQRRAWACKGGSQSALLFHQISGSYGLRGIGMDVADNGRS